MKSISFTEDMVKAILSGEKTQTRRPFKKEELSAFESAIKLGEVSDFISNGELGKNDMPYLIEFCSYGSFGGILIVKNHKIELFIKSISVERLHDITEGDALAEGVAMLDGLFDELEYCDMAQRIGATIGDAKPLFAQLWESIYGQGSWDKNPFVWRIEFEAVQN